MKNFSSQKWIAVFIFSMFLNFNTLAQFAVGVKAGGGVSQVNVLPLIEQEFAIGQTVGCFITYQPQPKNQGKLGLSGGIQMEFNYVKKGWKETAQFYSNQVEYFQIAPLTSIATGRKNFNILFQFGPQIGFLNKAYQEADGKKGLLTETASFADSTTSYEFSVTGGMGFQYKTRVGIFALNMRYEHSLSNVVKVYERSAKDIIRIGTDNDLTFWMQNQFLHVDLAYSFALGKSKKSKPEDRVK